MPEVVTKTAPTPVDALHTTSATLSSLVQAAVAAPSGTARDDACVSFSAHVRTHGLMSLFHPEDMMQKIVDLSTSSGKAGVAERETAGLLLLELTKTLEQAVEPILVPKAVPAVMALLADKDRRVQKAAEMALNAFFENVSTHSFSNIMPLLTNTDNKWQSLELQMNTLSQMAIHKMTVQVSLSLPTLIPVVSQLMWHDKAQVKAAAISSMTAICNTMTNRDLLPFVPQLIDTVLTPETVEICLEQLAGKIFVAEVRADALAVIMPLLMRGLLPYRSTATKRQCAKIIDNMSKLVPEVKEVDCFLPLLLPALERTISEVANPECREVCSKVLERLTRAQKEIAEAAVATPPLTIETVVGMLALPSDAPENNAAAKYVAGLVLSLARQGMSDSEEWHRVLTPYMRSLRPHLSASVASKVGEPVEVLDGDVACEMVNKLFEDVKRVVIPASLLAEEEIDASLLLCDCNFSLAYGNKILLNNTNLRLVRGARYGLCGQNDCGKTSLMRAISRNQVEGFPDPTKVRTVFVETEIQGELSDLSVLEYIFADPLLRDCGVTREDMSKVLMTVGFEREGPASIDKQVGRLSGGWKMKLALARAMLLKADILLLDEPTNHLDTKNRQWVENYLQTLTNVTSIMVSHDSGFLDRVCTHILHIDNLKLKGYVGNLTAFVKQVPEAQAYFELKQQSKYTFKFPVPGNLEGVTSKGKQIMKMTNVTFTYPGAAAPQLTGVSVRVSLSSRVACVGPNGAGKSTMIKLLTGELIPDEGFGAEVWKHPNCRVAYVAQHAFHHIENHLDKTPNEYIRWRYQYGVDKEALQKSNMVVTPEELEKQKTVITVQLPDAEGTLKTEKRVIKELTIGRRQEHKGKKNEYEVLLQGGFDQKVWLPESQLVTLGFEKAMREVDERIAANVAGYARPLTADFVEQHIMDVGLEREFATHTRIKALSGGQKVKVVLAAALWKCPHIIIVDEPTNYLDRESLGALAAAIKEFEGGVVIVSHNNEFCNACCPETWVLENHTLNVQGDPEWLAMAEKEKVKIVEEDEEQRDAFGNTIKKLKKASRQDMKKLRKKMEQMRKDGQECWTDEELEKMGFDPVPPS